MKSTLLILFLSLSCQFAKTPHLVLWNRVLDNLQQEMKLTTKYSVVTVTFFNYTPSIAIIPVQIGATVRFHHLPQGSSEY